MIESAFCDGVPALATGFRLYTPPASVAARVRYVLWRRATDSARSLQRSMGQERGERGRAGASTTLEGEHGKAGTHTGQLSENTVLTGKLVTLFNNENLHSSFIGILFLSSTTRMR